MPCKLDSNPPSTPKYFYTYFMLCLSWIFHYSLRIFYIFQTLIHFFILFPLPRVTSPYLLGNSKPFFKDSFDGNYFKKSFLQPRLKVVSPPFHPSSLNYAGGIKCGITFFFTDSYVYTYSHSLEWCANKIFYREDCIKVDLESMLRVGWVWVGKVDNESINSKRKNRRRIRR